MEALDVGTQLELTVRLISVYAFPGSDADPTRIAAQVVSGVGFLAVAIIGLELFQRIERVMKRRLDSAPHPGSTQEPEEGA